MKRVQLLIAMWIISMFVLSMNGCTSIQTNENFCGNLTVPEIIEIAEQSVCVENATLNIDKELNCNKYTGTAWIGLNLEKSGCNPACVVDTVTEEAEINWRCTGLLPS